MKGLDSEDPADKKIAAPWLKEDIQFNNIKIKQSVAIFSDNDPFVYLKDAKIFKDKLGAKIIIQHRKGHYIENKTMKIPVLLKEILNIIKIR